MSSKTLHEGIKMYKRIILVSSFFSALTLLLMVLSCNTMDLPPEPKVIPADYSASWSPDGQLIAYQHYNPDLSDAIESNGLYVIDTLGQNKRRIQDGFALNPDWSPDSKKLVFHFISSDLYQISVVNLELVQLTYLGTARFPSWSADNRIVFESPYLDPKGTSVLWVVNAEGSGLIDISEHGIGAMRRPDWSPDLRNIVYSGYHSDNGSQIWIINTENMEKLPLTNNNFIGNRNPSWSPDGNHIAWEVVHDGGAKEIWIMNADGSNQRRLTVGMEPAWSPTSEKIVFSREVMGGDKIVLWIFNILTEEIYQLTY